ncbi:MULTISPECIES: hypothetical protein [unclassified Ruegeria]|uniref:hypothetical protein n=1 Tax=unclassified Ruegeria TaxID=2625375 RepID=UPI00148992D9|nr:MULTISPECIES: hypothetical protein [unclassified Ruegeria]NOD65611.1 hypothetical protein [Ruegeria sp. HKCCD6109]
MVDGPTEIEDLDFTEAKTTVVQGFVDSVPMAGRTDLVKDYMSTERDLEQLWRILGELSVMFSLAEGENDFFLRTRAHWWWFNIRESEWLYSIGLAR